MATSAEILASIDTGIATVLSAIASGNSITEYEEGPVRVKRNSPSELLAALRAMRREFAPAATTDRRGAAAFYGGRL